MGRRKNIFYGHKLKEGLNTALGFPDFGQAADCQSESSYEIPKIDWSKIKAKIDIEIPSYALEEINVAFGAELGFRVNKGIAGILSGETLEDQTSESDFLTKAKKIEVLA